MTADPSEPASGPPPPKPRRGNFVARHWRGELSLPVAYWAVAFFGSLVAIAAIALIDAVFLLRSQYDPTASFFGVALAWMVAAAIAAWQLVGTWRSAGHYEQEQMAAGGKAFWGRAAKVAVILGWVRLLAQLGESAAPQMTELARMAFLGDPDIPAFNLRLMSEGTEVEMTGGFKFGLTNAFIAVLNEAPGLKAVHLSSDGGRIGEAVKLFDVIRARGLTTYVSDVCASACTIAFGAGRERWVLPYSRLGYHRGTFPGVAILAGRDLETAYANAGISRRFIDRILATPNESIWFPSTAEMRTANVITGVAVPGQFGSDADEIALQAEAAKINIGLPRVADPVTTLETVTLTGRDWVYHYTVNASLTQIVQDGESGLREGLTADTCKNAEMRPLMKEAGFSYAFEYRFAGVPDAVTVRVDEAACARSHL